MSTRFDAHDPMVAAVLAAAAAPAEAPLPGEKAAVAEFRRAHRPSRRIPVYRFNDKTKLVAAALFGGLVMAGGAATAATGSVNPFQGHGNSHQPAVHQPSDTDTDDVTDTTDVEAPDTDANDHGSEVSDLATTTDLTGVEKGAAICDLASDHKCTTGRDHSQAGEHGKPTDDSATHTRQDGTHRQDATTHGAQINEHAATGQATATTHRPASS